ncbi:hypothetical protein Tco_1357037 [Tanacetum coccineum]
MLAEHGDGVAIIKRQRQDLHHDSVRDRATAPRLARRSQGPSKGKARISSAVASKPNQPSKERKLRKRVPKVELEDTFERSDSIPVRAVSAPLPHLGSVTSGFAGKPGFEDVRRCLDPLDTLARSALSHDADYDQIPEDDFATASRGEEIDMTFFPFAPGPYVIPYPFDGDSSLPYTKQQWDRPHLLKDNILYKEIFRDPDVYRKALDRTITPAKLRRTKSLLPLELSNSVNLLSALVVSHGYVKDLHSEVTTLDKKLEGALKDYGALDQENKELIDELARTDAEHSDQALVVRNLQNELALERSKS